MKGVAVDSTQDIRIWLVAQINELFCCFSWKALLSFIGSVLSWLIGGIDQLIAYLLILMIIDFIFGVSRALNTDSFSGTKYKAGLLKFLLYYTVILVANFADKAVGSQFLFLSTFGITLTISFKSFTLLYLTIHETISILEHLSFFGAPIPKPLLKKLKCYRAHISGDCDVTIVKEKTKTKTTVTTQQNEN